MAASGVAGGGGIGATPISMQQQMWGGGIPPSKAAEMGMMSQLAEGAQGGDPRMNPALTNYGQMGGVPMNKLDPNDPRMQAMQWSQGQAGGVPMTGLSPMQMGGMGLGAGIQFEAGDFGSLLRTMNAEKMQLEGELREEEDKSMKQFSDDKVGYDDKVSEWKL